jgi:hypothetical protein
MFGYYDTSKQMFGTDVLDAGRDASVSNRQSGANMIAGGNYDERRNEKLR